MPGCIAVQVDVNDPGIDARDRALAPASIAEAKARKRSSAHTEMVLV
jgi:hypothetical protein